MYDDYQMYDPGPATTGETMMTIYTMVPFLAYGFYVAFMQYKIAHRTGQADTAWWAFIPILNTLLLISMAGKSLKWIWLLLIPFVNVFAFFSLWMNTARNCGQSAVWGFLVMIPFINVIALFVLAMSSRPYVYPDFEDETGPTKPRKPQQVG